jgi:hypothetical protein
MKSTIKKINELVYGSDYIYYKHDNVNLEMLLVAISQKCHNIFSCYQISKNEISVHYSLNGLFIWQLNKTLTEQSEQTQQTIKNLFE